jgi:hypothetical protein
VPQHPVLYEILARDRVAELRRTAQIGALRRRRAGRPQVVRSARKATGWFLVDVGLRLASPSDVTRSP